MGFNALQRTRLLRIVAASALLSAPLIGCGDDHAPPPKPGKPQVDVVTLHAKPVTVSTDLPGRISPFRVAEVRPQVSGVILKRLFVEGDAVKAGQLLYQIDPAPYQASLASAEATLAHAQASVVAAQLTVDRYKALAQARAVSGQDLDNAIATLRQDEADVASGKAQVQTASINLAYTKVTAPISGRTGRSSVTEGALVTANQTASLVTVTDLDPVYVDVTQSTATILRLRRELANGQIEGADKNKAPVKLQLEDGTDYDQPGTLQFSEVTVDQNTGSVTLRALFPNPNNLLLPGMFVRASLEEGTKPDAVLAPQQGVTHSPAGAATALVVGADDKIEQRQVVTDRAIGDTWLVSKGLKSGDRLVVSGLQQIHPGSEVTVKDVTQAAASTPAQSASVAQ